MKISSIFAEGKLILILAGELDHHTAKEAMLQINDKLDTYLPHMCELDLSTLTFMDSSGIAVILKTYRRISEIGGKLWIDRVSPQPMKVLDASGIDRLISIAQNQEVR